MNHSEYDPPQVWPTLSMILSNISWQGIKYPDKSWPDVKLIGQLIIAYEFDSHFMSWILLLRPKFNTCQIKRILTWNIAQVVRSVEYIIVADPTRTKTVIALLARLRMSRRYLARTGKKKQKTTTQKWLSRVGHKTPSGCESRVLGCVEFF